MRVSWSSEKTSWTLRLRLDADDVLTGPGQGGSPVSLVTNECTVRLPFTVDEPHPDLLALAAALIVRPWVGSRLVLDRPVSPVLAEALHDSLGIDAAPVDDRLPARAPGPHVGLSYSSGVDSIAVSALLPPDTPHLHLQRVKHPRVPNRATHVRSDQMAQLARRAETRGRHVVVVETDLEYLCQPWPQYPTWPVIGIAVVLLADRYQLGALAYGSVLEAVYLGGGRRFTGNSSGGWKLALSAVGLPLCRPAAGLTEVGTLMIASRSDLADLAQSCLLGAAGRPCLACVKCARKEMLAAALERRDIHPRIRERLQPGDRVAADLEKPPPLYMQNSLEYALARIPRLEGTILADLARRMDVTVESTSWNERYYSPALSDEVPTRWRPGIEEQLRRRVEWMTAEDMKIVENWDGASRMR